MVQINKSTGFKRKVRRRKGKKQKRQMMFKDTDEQFLQDEKDRQDDEAKTSKLSQFFYNIHVPLAKKNLPKPTVVIEALQFCHKALDHEWESKPRRMNDCQICFVDP